MEGLVDPGDSGCNQLQTTHKDLSNLGVGTMYQVRLVDVAQLETTSVGWDNIPVYGFLGVELCTKGYQLGGIQSL